MSDTKFSFLGFYSRRIKRIFPALILVLTSCGIFGYFSLLPDEYKSLGKHISGGAGFISNLILWGESGYFDLAGETKPLLHLWSLGVEEQFYLFWPALLFIAWRFRWSIPALIIITGIASFGLNIVGIKQNPIATFYYPHTRLWELMAGSLVAWIYFSTHKHVIEFKNKPFLIRFIHSQAIKFPILIQNICANIGILLIAYGLLFFNKSTEFPGKWALFPVIGTALIIFAGPGAWVNRVMLSNKLLVWLGLISFPLYLWHWPLLTFFKITDGEGASIIARTTIVIIAIALSWATYRFVEKPIRQTPICNKNIIIYLIIFLLFVGLTGFYIKYKNGFKLRFEKNEKILELIENPLPEISGYECSTAINEFKGITFSGCWLNTRLDPKIVFIGDSHIGMYRNPIWEFYDGFPIMILYQYGCLPFAGKTYSSDLNCKNLTNKVYDYINSSKSIKKVVISANWALLMSGGIGEQGARWRHSRQLYGHEELAFKENANRILSSLTNSGKEIIFLMDIPDLNFNIRSCFDIRLINTVLRVDKPSCTMSSSEFYDRMRPYDDAIFSVLKNYPKIKIYDPRTILCRDKLCIASDGNLPFYENGDHLNRYGAEFIFKSLGLNFR